jgi:hypothetical protein
MEMVGARSGYIVHIRYRDVEPFVSTGRPDEGLPGRSGYGDLGYDQANIAASTGFVHRLLLSNWIEFAITFGNVEIEEVALQTTVSERQTHDIQ